MKQPTPKRLRRFLQDVREAVTPVVQERTTTYETKGDMVWPHSFDGSDVAESVLDLVIALDRELAK